jgi:hypothetical protein
VITENDTNISPSQALLGKEYGKSNNGNQNSSDGLYRDIENGESCVL